MMATKSITRFMDLTQEHEDLDELFLKHQEKLVEQDLPAATSLLASYRSELLEHMELEETGLFPIYDRLEALPGGGVHLFQAEHDKIREILESVERRLSDLSADGPDLSRQIVQLLDEESLLKRVMEHHDLRERRFLYPMIDQSATDAERHSVLGRRV
jgi:iron-sulfur cluster repair protein YtfE (RIC family)